MCRISIFFFYVHILICSSYLHAQSSISIRQFGVDGIEKRNESEISKFKRWQAIKKAFDHAIKYKVNLFFPKGVYDVGERNFPFREDDSNTNILLDCKGVIISGDGRGTVLKTSSKRGADVLQLNMLKNITIKNFDITANLYSQIEAGSNGISVTNGYDNITLDNLYIYNLPGIVREGYIDGGKGLTMQFTASKSAVKGTLRATNIKVKNCAYGFRFDAANVSDLLKAKINLDIQIDVDKAYQGFAMDFGEAAEKVNTKSKLNVRAIATLKNCQQYIRFSRVIGGVYDFTLERTDSYDEVRKDKAGQIWTQFDKKVFGFLSNYTKSATVSVFGNVGNVDYKVWIGAVGSIDEPFNLKNRTENCIFNFDITGNSKKDDFQIVRYKGESIHSSIINIRERTMRNGKAPLEFKINNNQLNIKQ